jgi:hypothetical protein
MLQSGKILEEFWMHSGMPFATACRRMNAGDKVRMVPAAFAAFLLAACAVFSATPVLAIEQCRFIDARAEREACYERQAAELAAKRQREADRAAAAASDSKSFESLEQMRREDEALNRQLRNICRGC